MASHVSKDFDRMIDLARQCCRVIDCGNTVKLFPFDKTKQLFVVHRGERAFHPTRRFLKNQLGIFVGKAGDSI